MEQLTAFINQFVVSRSDVDPTWYILIGILVIMYFLLQQPVTPATPPTTPVVPPTAPLPTSTTIPVIDEIIRTDDTEIRDEQEVGTTSSYQPGCFRQESMVVNDPSSGLLKTSVKTFGITSDQQGNIVWDLVK